MWKLQIEHFTFIKQIKVIYLAHSYKKNVHGHRKDDLL